MRPIRLMLILICSLGVTAFADELGDRQKLMGSWELNNVADNGAATSWTFSTAKNTTRVSEVEQGKKVAEFACGTEGASCEIKSAGKKATVSMWFNGSQLVELETMGSQVIKRRFKILPEADRLQMEVIPIVPAGKPETFDYKRTQLSALQH